jgi:hypothetical protein
MIGFVYRVRARFRRRQWNTLAMAPELARYYPNAKVLLSVRDPDKWFESTRETTLCEELARCHDAGQGVLPRDRFQALRGPFRDREFITSYFKRHRNEVQRAIPKDRLLVYEVGQGWEPLCSFLDVPVPDTPFPRMCSFSGMSGLSSVRVSG